MIFKEIKENAEKFKEYCNFLETEIFSPEKEEKIYYDFTYIPALEMQEMFNKLKK